MQNVSHAGNDRPVKEGQDDRYGFEPLAAGLARRILALNRTVIGIEGRWGAGKTSLLNLLMEHLSERKSEKTKILPISPWLSPPGSPLMESLMLSVAALLIVHI
ncbi:P-loop NTPase fold protein [Pantoea sp. PGP6]